MQKPIPTYRRRYDLFALMVGGVAAATLGMLIDIMVWSSQNGY